MKLFSKLKMLGIGTCLAATVVVTGVSVTNAIDPRVMLIDYSNIKLANLKLAQLLILIRKYGQMVVQLQVFNRIVLRLILDMSLISIFI